MWLSWCLHAFSNAHERLQFIVMDNYKKYIALAKFGDSVSLLQSTLSEGVVSLSSLSTSRILWVHGNMSTNNQTAIKGLLSSVYIGQARGRGLGGGGGGKPNSLKFRLLFKNHSFSLILPDYWTPRCWGGGRRKHLRPPLCTPVSLFYSRVLGSG